jgi:flagellin-like hook-associated protein FlgL
MQDYTLTQETISKVVGDLYLRLQATTEQFGKNIMDLQAKLQAAEKRFDDLYKENHALKVKLVEFTNDDTGQGTNNK